VASRKIETCWSNFKCFNVKKFYVCALVGVLIKQCSRFRWNSSDEIIALVNICSNPFFGRAKFTFYCQEQGIIKMLRYILQVCGIKETFCGTIEKITKNVVIEDLQNT